MGRLHVTGTGVTGAPGDAVLGVFKRLDQESILVDMDVRTQNKKSANQAPKGSAESFSLRSLV